MRRLMEGNLAWEFGRKGPGGFRSPRAVRSGRRTIDMSPRRNAPDEGSRKSVWRAGEDGVEIMLSAKTDILGKRGRG